VSEAGASASRLRSAVGMATSIVLGALLALSPWFEGGASPSGLFVCHTLVFLLLALSWSGSRLERLPGLGAGWEAPMAAALLAICVVSFLRVDYFYGSFLALWNVLMAMLLAVAVWLAGARPARMVTAIVSLTSAAQAIALFLLPAGQNVTPSASFANANQLAAYLNVGTCFAMAGLVASWRAGRAGRAGSKARAGGWAAIVMVNGAALARIGSRGALAGLIAAAAFGILLSVPADRRKLRFALWSGLAAVMILAALAVAWRFQRIEDPYQFDRVRIWKAGLDATREHPALGMGPGMFERRAYRYNFPLEREMFRYSKLPGSTHSTWLQASTQIGVVGLAAALMLSAILLARLRQTRKLATGPGLALIACLVHGFVDTPFEVPAVAFALIAALVPALMPEGPMRAPLYVAFRWRRDGPARALVAAAAAATVTAWLGAVFFPFVAWSASERGDFETAIRRDRFNPLYHAERAETAWRAGRPVSLLTPPTLALVDMDLRGAHGLDPGNPEHLLGLGQLHAHACFEIGADPAVRARAEEYYREALALGLKDPRPRLELAAFMLAQSRTAEGIDQIRAALAIEPRYVAARQALVRALRQAGQAGPAADEETRLEETRRELAGYRPKNGYEEDLMRPVPGTPLSR